MYCGLTKEADIVIVILILIRANGCIRIKQTRIISVLKEVLRLIDEPGTSPRWKPLPSNESRDFNTLVIMVFHDVIFVLRWQHPFFLHKSYPCVSQDNTYTF